MSEFFNENDIDFWVQNGLNVLFKGKHGTGKTARVLEAFERHGLKYQYYSTSTMDPWVDFIGVPKEMKTEDGKSYLGLVRPRQFAEDEVEAIFLDEFNRSSKKVRNAVMELIQFRSINGKKFKNLKMVWAAINPDDEEKTYDVEPLDPAQQDRFVIQVEVPYLPSLDYFTKRFGTGDAKAALDWWHALEPKQKDRVSPRRLDYALEVFLLGGNIRNVMGPGINTTSLIDALNNGSITERLMSFINNNDTETGRTFLRNENNYNSALPAIIKNTEMKKFFVPLLTDEKVISLMNKNEDIKNTVFNNYKQFKDVVTSLAEAGSSELSSIAQKTVLLNEPAIQTRDRPPGSIYVTATTLPIKHNPDKNVSGFLKSYQSTMAGSKRTPQEIYQFLTTETPFDFVSEDETQKNGSLLAHAVVDMTCTITEQASPADLAKMTDLTKVLNHVLLYMGTFQMEDKESQIKHDPNDFIVRDPARLNAALAKLSGSELGFDVKVA